MLNPAQSSPNPAQQQPPQMAPQGNPPAAPTIAPQHDGKPSGRVGQPYDPNILAGIEKHLSQLPDDQKGYLVQYMTPELAIILGIVIGTEGYDYFRQFADPKKMLVVQPRPEQPNTAPQPGQAQQPQSTGQQQPPAPQPAQSVQPKANVPAKSIMGV